MIRFLINLAGLPPTTVHDSTSLTTSDSAPTTAPSPIVTPFEIVALVAIQTLLPIIVGEVVISKCEEEIL